MACLAFAGCAPHSRSDRPVAPLAIGTSRENRSLIASTLGEGPLRVYVVGGIHGDETEGLRAVPALRASMAQGSWSARATVRVLEDMNPDGTARATRANAARVDLNRAWPATNATGRVDPQPESEAALADITRFGPAIVVVLHSSGSGPFVNFDGPADRWAEMFAKGANAELVRCGRAGRWRVRAHMGYPTPGSMGSYWGKDLGIPILTVEFARGCSEAEAVPALLGGVRALIGAE
ncbi:MAG: M14 family zinc carboxypeptidase [Phycisphaerales bacterium]